MPDSISGKQKTSANEDMGLSFSLPHGGVAKRSGSKKEQSVEPVWASLAQVWLSHSKYGLCSTGADSQDRLDCWPFSCLLFSSSFRVLLSLSLLQSV